jgi:hypothetical protein
MYRVASGEKARRKHEMPRLPLLKKLCRRGAFHDLFPEATYKIGPSFQLLLGVKSHVFWQRPPTPYRPFNNEIYDVEDFNVRAVCLAI